MVHAGEIFQEDSGSIVGAAEGRLRIRVRKGEEWLTGTGHTHTTTHTIILRTPHYGAASHRLSTMP